MRIDVGRNDRGSNGETSVGGRATDAPTPNGGRDGLAVLTKLPQLRSAILSDKGSKVVDRAKGGCAKRTISVLGDRQ